jgi:hypothetical protein
MPKRELFPNPGILARKSVNLAPPRLTLPLAPPVALVYDVSMTPANWVLWVRIQNTIEFWDSLSPETSVYMLYLLRDPNVILP